MIVFACPFFFLFSFFLFSFPFQSTSVGTGNAFFPSIHCRIFSLFNVEEREKAGEEGKERKEKGKVVSEGEVVQKQRFASHPTISAHFSFTQHLGATRGRLSLVHSSFGLLILLDFCRFRSIFAHNTWHLHCTQHLSRMPWLLRKTIGLKSFQNYFFIYLCAFQRATANAARMSANLINSTKETRAFRHRPNHFGMRDYHCTVRVLVLGIVPLLRSHSVALFAISFWRRKRHYPGHLTNCALAGIRPTSVLATASSFVWRFFVLGVSTVFEPVQVSNNRQPCHRHSNLNLISPSFSFFLFIVRCS